MWTLRDKSDRIFGMPMELDSEQRKNECTSLNSNNNNNNNNNNNVP
jgi:hypothetical protein